MLKNPPEKTSLILGIEIRKILFYALLFLAISIFLLFIHLQRLPGGKLVVNFLNVGQGDAALITTPDNCHILIDGGPDAQVITELGEILPFLDKKIAVMILTHPHRDHLAGLIAVLNYLQVEKIILTGVINENDPYFEEFLLKIKTQNIPIQLAKKGDLLDLSAGAQLQFLNPWENLAFETIANLNNTSLVLRLSYGEKSLLFLGDIETEAENNLLNNPDLKSDIVKIAHHGSKIGTSALLINKVNPKYAVISVGKNNQFGHPAKETLEQLTKASIIYFRTDLNGRITFKIIEQEINYFKENVEKVRN